MRIFTLNSGEDVKRYDTWIHARSHGSLWQSLERKKYVEACSKTTKIYIAEDDGGNIAASALVIIDRTTGGFSVWDIPRGPLWKAGNEKFVPALLEAIVSDARKDQCIAIYLSTMGTLPVCTLPLRPSSRRIHAEATRILDLAQSEDQILASMHQKARYNIKVAQKHGIEIAEGDIDAFYSLLKGTGGRDGFKISQKSHYAHFLHDLDGSFVMMAKHEGKPVAGLIGTMWNGTGFYYYGASSYEHRHLMAPYLLQWEAMMHCKRLGCMRYNLLGIAPEGSAKDNPWAGITEFKRKFGGEVITYPQEQMIVLKPIAKRMLEWKRRVFG